MSPEVIVLNIDAAQTAAEHLSRSALVVHS